MISRPLRLATIRALVQHLRVEFDLSRTDALSLIHSQADAYNMIIDRGVRMTDATTLRDLVDFFVPMGLWPKWEMVPVTVRAKAAAAAAALRDPEPGTP